MNPNVIFARKAIAMIVLLFMGLAVGAPMDSNEAITSHDPSNPSQGNNTYSPIVGQAYGGDLTWYETGLGACGWYNNGGDYVCAVSRIVFDHANVDGNPNHNPLCGRRIHIQRGGNGIDVTLVDRCEGCAEFDIDVTRSVFQQLGNLDEGRVHTEWWWI